jgi:peptidoglycan/xylan/chitin deacetylase (PgdA/CDA1 family)
MTKIKLYKKIIASSSSLIPLNLLQKSFPNKTIFPFYHTVSDQNLPHINKLYSYRNIKKFKKDIELLLKYYKPISIYDYLQNNKNNKQKYFVLSFDDGLSQIYDIIAPILTKKGIPAIFFINPDFINNNKMFFKHKISLILNEIDKNPKKLNLLKKEISLKINNINDITNINYSNQYYLDLIAKKIELNYYEYLKKYSPYINFAQLSELKKQGFSIGAHSSDHPLFSDLTEKKQLKQISDSVEYVTNNFNEKLRLFAFPYTDYGISKNLFNIIYEKNIVDISFGTAGLKLDHFEKNIQRIPMENFTSAKKTLKFQYLYFELKKIFDKNKIIRI